MNARITSSKIIISLFILSIMFILNSGLGFASEGLLDGKVFTGQTGKKGTAGFIARDEGERGG